LYEECRCSAVALPPASQQGSGGVAIIAADSPFLSQSEKEISSRMPRNGEAIMFGGTNRAEFREPGLHDSTGPPRARFSSENNGTAPLLPIAFNSENGNTTNSSARHLLNTIHARIACPLGDHESPLALYDTLLAAFSRSALTAVTPTPTSWIHDSRLALTQIAAPHEPLSECWREVARLPVTKSNMLR
jgi:hypothetical protein